MDEATFKQFCPSGDNDYWRIHNKTSLDISPYKRITKATLKDCKRQYQENAFNSHGNVEQCLVKQNPNSGVLPSTFIHYDENNNQLDCINIEVGRLSKFEIFKKMGAKGKGKTMKIITYDDSNNKLDTKEIQFIHYASTELQKFTQPAQGGQYVMGIFSLSVPNAAGMKFKISENIDLTIDLKTSLDLSKAIAPHIIGGHGVIKTPKE